MGLLNVCEAVGKTKGNQWVNPEVNLEAGLLAGLVVFPQVAEIIKMTDHMMTTDVGDMMETKAMIVKDTTAMVVMIISTVIVTDIMIMILISTTADIQTGVMTRLQQEGFQGSLSSRRDRHKRSDISSRNRWDHTAPMTGTGVLPTAAGTVMTIMTTGVHLLIVEAAGVNLLTAEVVGVHLLIGTTGMILMTGLKGTVLNATDAASSSIVLVKIPEHLIRGTANLLSGSDAAPADCQNMSEKSASILLF